MDKNDLEILQQAVDGESLALWELTLISCFKQICQEFKKITQLSSAVESTTMDNANNNTTEDDISAGT